MEVKYFKTYQLLYLTLQDRFKYHPISRDFFDHFHIRGRHLDNRRLVSNRVQYLHTSVCVKTALGTDAFQFIQTI